MSVLVVADHDNASLDAATFAAVGAARKAGGDIDILVAGYNAGSVRDEAVRTAGIRQVLYADDVQYENHLAENYAALIVSVAAGYDTIVKTADTTGKNVMPRVAALLDVMQVSDVVSIEEPGVFVRPVYAGNAMETVRSADPVKVLTVRATAFPAVEEKGPAVPVRVVDIPESPELSGFAGRELTGSDRPDLSSAKIVISGGRGLGSSENFEQYLFPLADRLGAAVGASRAAVDAGYVPNDYQVGQTGKIVAPALYIAVGISGAIQHLAGMKDSGIIVAINKDEEAPIFQISDYGLVGDLFTVLPEMLDAMK